VKKYCGLFGRGSCDRFRDQQKDTDC